MSRWVWLCTAAKAMSLTPEQAATRQVVICDELHHFTKGGGWGKSLHSLFPHVFHWFGCSGTYFRSGGDEMSLEAFLSEIVFRIGSAKLLELGRLVKTRVAFVPVVGPKVRGADPRRPGLWHHEYRNTLVAASALHMASAAGRRVLVLAAVKPQGQAITDAINAHAPWSKRGAWRFAEFLFRGRGGAGPRDSEFRRRLIGDFLEGRGPAVLVGTSLLGEGVDLPDADALVWARGGSAAVSYLQSLYRVCTASPGKSSALIIDFADRHHGRLLEASVERLKIAASDPVFQPQVLNDPTEIGPWAQGG